MASTSAAVVPIGVRATKTQNAINRASERVVERITLETMEQSFPDLLENDSDRDFIRLLTERTADHLRAGFQVRDHCIARGPTPIALLLCGARTRLDTDSRFLRSPLTGSLGGPLHKQSLQNLHRKVERGR